MLDTAFRSPPRCVALTRFAAFSCLIAGPIDGQAGNETREFFSRLQSVFVKGGVSRREALMMVEPLSTGPRAILGLVLGLRTGE